MHFPPHPIHPSRNISAEVPTAPVITETFPPRIKLLAWGKQPGYITGTRVPFKHIENHREIHPPVMVPPPTSPEQPLPDIPIREDETTAALSEPTSPATSLRAPKSIASILEYHCIGALSLPSAIPLSLLPQPISSSPQELGVWPTERLQVGAVFGPPQVSCSVTARLRVGAVFGSARASCSVTTRLRVGAVFADNSVLPHQPVLPLGIGPETEPVRSVPNTMAQKWEMKRPLAIKELEAVVEDIQNGDDIDAVYIPPDVDTLTDEEDLDDDVVLEKAPVTDVAGTLEVHVESSDDDESIAEPSTSNRKKMEKQKLPLPSWKKANQQSQRLHHKFRFYLVISLIQSEAKNAFEVAMEEEKSDTEQPRTTTSWGRPSRDSLPKEVRYDEIVSCIGVVFNIVTQILRQKHTKLGQWKTMVPTT
ncbi:hypothetical protein ILUMI_07859 [Ignelater luminosus]|uniref:Uncharacterized protein n=1 Tax=Ignelater luminosus TaxID=2038154 RepID=A0A8K0D6P9_IGNLU|nr:hypothetical protein ILUMI_07859 [Ignelater luminosus]